MDNPCWGTTFNATSGHPALLRIASFLVAGLLLLGCSSAGDPEQIGKHARAVKALAADTTNALLYLSTSIKVQMGEMKVLEKGFTVLKDHPKVQALTGFQSLAPTYIGVSEALRLTRPARVALTAATVRAQKLLDEIHTDLPALRTDFSANRSALGASAKIFDQAHAEIDSAIKSFEDFIAAMPNYLESANDMQSSANSMLRELDVMSKSATFQDEGAAIIRLNAFDGNMLDALQKMTAAFRSEVSSQEAGVAALLRCFRTLDSIRDLPPDLSSEMRDAIKLLDEVSKGATFSPKPQ